MISRKGATEGRREVLGSIVRRLKDSTLLAVVFVVLLSIGTAAATKLITGKDIADHSITGRDIKRHSLPLSALKALPAGPAGPTGATGRAGANGLNGARGLIGPAGKPGATGPGSLNTVFDVSQTIPDIAPSDELQYLGAPATFLLPETAVGFISETVSVGTTEAPIDSTANLKLVICYQLPEEPSFPITALVPEGVQEFGVSPLLGRRTAVTLGGGFVTEPEEAEEGPVEVKLGPCVLNDTGETLDDNYLAEGYIWFTVLTE